MTQTAHTPMTTDTPQRPVVRRAAERGHANHGWLDTWHSFSFANYYDPAHMGYRALRVINDDRVAPGAGFPTHPHRDMEIITYVLDGAIAHKDSMGNGSIIEPGDVQRMSAGTGVRHSEFNASSSQPLRLLQIWIEPDTRGLEPSYEQKSFEVADRQGRLRLVASPDGAEGSVTIHQDARIYASVLDASQSVEHENREGRHVWIQVARGRIRAAGIDLEEGDGLAIEAPGPVAIEGLESAELLLFDLA